MRRSLSFLNRRRLLLLLAIFFTGVYLFSSWYARELRLVSASFRMLNDAQTIWYPNPILDYRIVVDVIRPGESRRNEIEVENGEIVYAMVQYRRRNGWGWDEAYALNEAQAYPFTIPGLYEMVRGALRASNRTRIRVDLQGDPPFPHEIEFGPVWQNGMALRETVSRVIVREFEIPAP